MNSGPCIIRERKITEETYRRWSHVWKCRVWEQRWGWTAAACASSCPGRMSRSSPALTTVGTEEVSESPSPGRAPAVPPWPSGDPAPRLVGWRSVNNVTKVTSNPGALTWGKWIVSPNYDPNESVLRAPASFLECTFKSVQRLLLTLLPLRPSIFILCANNTIIVPKRMWTNVETCLFVNSRDAVFNLSPFFVEHIFSNTVGIKIWPSLMKIEWSFSKTI